MGMTKKKGEGNPGGWGGGQGTVRIMGGGTVPPRVRSTGDGRGVDGPGVNAYVKRYGGTWGVNYEGR